MPPRLLQEASIGRDIRKYIPLYSGSIIYPSPFQSVPIDPTPKVHLSRFHHRHTSTIILPQHPQIQPIKRADLIPAGASFRILGEARPRRLHVVAQRDFLGGRVGGWVGTKDERDFSAVVDAAVGKGLDVGEGGVEDEAPGWIAGFSVAGCEEGGNLDGGIKVRLGLLYVGRGRGRG